MDPISLGFLLLILIASGGIAYVADGLGKKIGKKRLSVFGLRPKHVAQLGTVGMGVVVSLLTILVIAAASRDVRDWLVRGRGLLVEQKRLKGEVDDLEKQRLKEETEKRRVTAELDRTNVQLKNTQKAAQDQGEQLKRIGAKRDALLASVAGLRNEIGRIDSELRQTKLAFAQSTSDLTFAKARLASTTTRLKGTEAQIAVTRKNLGAAQKGLSLAESKFQYQLRKNNEVMLKSVATSVQSEELGKQVAEYEKQVEAQKTRLASLQTEAQSLEDQRNQAQTRLDAVQANLAEKQANLQKVQQDYDLLQSFSQSTFRSSRTEPLTYRAGEEITRVFIPAGAGPDAARTALDSLLQDARTQAEARGAKGHRSKGQLLGAADIIDRTDPKTGAVVDADALKKAVVARIAGNSEDQALVATSSLNAFSGETVSLEIAVVPNPVIYHRNEMLAETRIDGSQSDEGILTQLREFLGIRVRDRAVQDRMVPRAGSRDPFGEIPATSWLSLVQDVKRAGRPVRVQALAGDDTRAADPLHLEFRVK